jgi:Spy/CpxP family protein refolding chaperone
MRIHRLLLILVTATLLAQAAPQARQRGQQGAQPRPAVAALQAALGLTGQQVEQLAQLRREMAEALRPVREQMQQKAQELKQATGAANPDPALIGKLTLEVRSLRQRVRQIQEDYRNRALSLLTAEQREKLQNLQQNAQRAARLAPAIAGARGLGLLAPPPPGDDAVAAEPNRAPGRRIRQPRPRQRR